MSPKDLGHNPLLFSLFDLPQGAMPQVLEIGKSNYHYHYHYHYHYYHYHYHYHYHCQYYCYYCCCYCYCYYYCTSKL